MPRCRARRPDWPPWCGPRRARSTALGSGEKVCLPAEAVNLSASRRSLCAARRLPAGHILRARRRDRAAPGDRSCARTGGRPGRPAADARRGTRDRRWSKRTSSHMQNRDWTGALPNVLITAASRRVPLVNAFSRALAQLGAGRVVVTDVNPLSPAVYASERAYRVPLASDPHYIDEVLAIAVGEQVGVVIPTIDDELTMFASAGTGLPPLACASWSRRRRRRCSATTSWRPAGSFGALASRRPSRTCRRICPSRRPFRSSSSRGTAAAASAHLPIQNARELAFFLDYVPDPVVQEFLDGPGVHDRHALRLRGAPALDRAARARRHSRRRDRPRPDGEGRAAHRAGHRVRGGAAVCRPDQHPVPHRGRAAGHLRDQPALFRRHPAHDRGRRRFPADDAAVGRRLPGRSRRSDASATTCG